MIPEESLRTTPGTGGTPSSANLVSLGVIQVFVFAMLCRYAAMLERRIRMIGLPFLDSNFCV